MNNKKLLFVYLIFTILLFSCSIKNNIFIAVAKKTIESNLSANPIAKLPDGLHVVLCGTGSPFPDEKRMGPCTVVFAGQRMFVFDAGTGGSRNISRMKLNNGNIEALFLTHYHSDHIDGLGELMLQRWVSVGNSSPLPIYGPQGLDTVITGIMQAYSLDKNYRISHHGNPTVPSTGFGAIAKSFKLDGVTNKFIVIKDKDLEISSFLVDHSPIEPAVGYKITYKDRSIVISGDTKKNIKVLEESKGVDLLLHEALSPYLVGLIEESAIKVNRPNLQKIMKDIVNYHTSPEEAAEIARDAKVNTLVFHHIVPPLPTSLLEPIFLGNTKQIFSGKIHIGLDGDIISLPTGSTKINFNRLL